MKHLKLCMALGLVVAVTAPAWGVSLSPGPKTIDITDWTSLYSPLPIGPLPRAPAPCVPLPGGRAGQLNEPLAPTGTFVPPAIGVDENRAVFVVNFIQAPDGTVDFQKPALGGTEGELSGLFYDLTPIGTTPAPVGGTNVYYGPAGRNPILAAPAGTGGVLEVWLDPAEVGAFPLETATPPGNALGVGPCGWDEADTLGLIPGLHGHAPGGPDGYPSVNQAGETLWLQLAFLPHPDQTFPGTVLRETLPIGVPGATVGSGDAWAHILGGTAAPLFVTGQFNAAYAAAGGVLPPGTSADFRARFNIDVAPLAEPLNGFQAVSRDPVTAAVIPEPVTIVGAFMAVGSLGAYIRRRHRRA